MIDTQSRQTISDRTRDGGTAVLQMQPTDTLILTGDYLYSKFTVKDVRHGGGAYLWAWMCAHQDANGACTQTSPGTTIDSNGFYPRSTCQAVSALGSGRSTSVTDGVMPPAILFG